MIHVKPEHLMPLTMMGLSLIACMVYAAHHDWRRAVYWAAAAVITASVTF